MVYVRFKLVNLRCQHDALPKLSIKLTDCMCGCVHFVTVHTSALLISCIDKDTVHCQSLESSNEVGSGWVGPVQHLRLRHSIV